MAVSKLDHQRALRRINAAVVTQTLATGTFFTGSTIDVATTFSRRSLSFSVQSSPTSSI